MRDMYCGDVTADQLDQTLTIAGWVDRRRDHGGVIFLDMRDREGILQVVIDPDTAEAFATADRAPPRMGAANYRPRACAPRRRRQ